MSDSSEIARLDERTRAQDSWMHSMADDVKELKTDIKDLVKAVNTMSTERRLVGSFGGFVGALCTYVAMSFWPMKK